MEDNYEIGTTISGKLLGDKNGQTNLYVWIDCPDCDKKRWVQLSCLREQNKQGQCHPCYMKGREHGPNWKGGRIYGGGKGSPYIQIWITEDNFYYPMVRVKQNGGGYICEHRLVIAQNLGRCLHPWEIVHHFNGVRDDNRLENLQLISDVGHKQMSHMLRKIAKLEKENYELLQKLQEIPLS